MNGWNKWPKNPKWMGWNYPIHWANKRIQFVNVQKSEGEKMDSIFKSSKMFIYTFIDLAED